MRILYEDLRYSMRKLAATPGVVALIVLTLGIGAGANTAIYSVADALLFRTLPVAAPDRLLTVIRGAGTRETSSYLDYRDLRDGNTSFSQLAAEFDFPVVIGRGEKEDRRMCGMVSGNYFAALGLTPALGRFITSDDDGAPGTGDAVVLSHQLWRNEFAGDPGIIGKAIVLNDRTFTIAGVAPESFRGALMPFTTALWVPLSLHSVFMPAIVETEATRDGRWLLLLGRLKEGVSVAQAEANLNAIEGRIQREHQELGKTAEQRLDRALHLSVPRGVFVPHIRRMIGIAATLMLVVTGMLVLLACVNVAGILLAKATAREREVTLRMALGASRSRILRQLLTESALLGVLGGLAGIALAYFSLSVLGDLQGPIAGARQFSAGARVDLRVLGYGLALAFATTVFFGLAPALQATRQDLISVLKEGATGSRGSRRANRMRQALVVGQFAAALVLLAVTGLMVRGLQKMHSSDPGFETQHQAFVSLLLTNRGEQQAHFLNELKQRAEALPGVVATSWAATPPSRLGGYEQTELQLDGGGIMHVRNVRVDGAFFGVTGINLLRGRTFAERDTHTGGNFIIVNEAMARRLWPNRDPVGQIVRLGSGAPLEVIGVARNSKYDLLAEDAQPFFYRPWLAGERFRASLIVRTAGPPELVVQPLRQLVRRLDPSIDINRGGTFAEDLRISIWPTLIGVRFLSTFSILGLLLSAAGLFGVMSYQVERRRQEIGIRMAVGARRGEVMGLILRRGAFLALLGAGIGTMASFGVTRLLANIVPGIPTTDALTYLVAPVVLLLVSIAASWAPAVRAMRVDPITALRSE